MGEKIVAADMGLLVLLKMSHRLGYFVPLTKIAEAIIRNAVRAAGVPLIPADVWNKYHVFGAHKRHRALIRDYLGIRFSVKKPDQS
ncbi:MAG: hypothetical protein C7B43_19345 [Sulfobacillus benefaciens]|jgi:hypothetical protein|uniref:DUF4158 domain-containing protein n=1 Tax=Sulfobacillus benefaciens TaxID=453960 RepID=A0A2T2WQ24_9FIRM|nr:MAG: hypothetical protein C7B43_19345 [Sulfobacillus benefaciens]